MMLSSSVLQQLGKIVNPLTNKAEVNLEGAQISIDMLSVLKEKTKGNLDKDEEKILNDILSSLQMNYVETVNSAGAQTAKEPGAPAQAQETPEASGQEQTEQPRNTGGEKSRKTTGQHRPAGDETKHPKFHKSYDD